MYASMYVCRDLLVRRYTASCNVDGINSLLFPLRTSLESSAVIAVVDMIVFLCNPYPCIYIHTYIPDAIDVLTSVSSGTPTDLKEGPISGNAY